MFVKPAAVLLMAAATFRPMDEARYRELIKSHGHKILLVSFWASWCEPCREELPELAAMTSRLPAGRFSLATVCLDEPEQSAEALRYFRTAHLRGRPFLKTPGGDDRFISSVDPEWSGVLPALFLYDESGKILAAYRGGVVLSDMEKAIRRFL